MYYHGHDVTFYDIHGVINGYYYDTTILLLWYGIGIIYGLVWEWGAISAFTLAIYNLRYLGGSVGQCMSAVA